MRPCFFLEPLEPRLTLSAGFIATDGIPGGAIRLDLGHQPFLPLFLFQPDGKIIATDNNPDDGTACYNDWGGLTYFARFNSDGSRDVTFADNGIINLPCAIPGFDQILRQPDGKILGMTDTAEIFRFTEDGRLDSSFYPVTFPSVYSGYHLDLRSMALFPNGSIVAGGEAWTDDQSGLLAALIRLNADGSPDLDFGTQGAVAPKYASLFSSDSSLTVQLDGKILTISRDNDDYYYAKPATLRRFNPDGTPDQTFGTHGKFRFAIPGTYNPVLLEPDGKIIEVLSDFRDPRPSVSDLTLFRLNADGTADESFANNGRSSSWWHGNNSWLQSFLQPDGKIIVIDYNGIIARFT